jgi:hypothetical protein
MNLTWMIMGIGMCAAMASMLRRSQWHGRRSDLGYVSDRWIEEHRLSWMRRCVFIHSPPGLCNREQRAYPVGATLGEVTVWRWSLSTGATRGRYRKKIFMMYPRTMTICGFAILCSTQLIGGQRLSQYRNFELGSDLASVAALADTDASDARTLHHRPALLQELEWRPSRWMVGSMTQSTDPVDRIVFSFYNDQLFRVVVDYGREQTEGMTGADMIEGVSAVYGTPLPRRARDRAMSRLESESGALLARWGDVDDAVALFQASSFDARFRLIVTATRLDDLARKAETQALRLDDQEAPLREIARQKKERDDSRAAAAKARTANKSAFRP